MRSNRNQTLKLPPELLTRILLISYPESSIFTSSSKPRFISNKFIDMESEIECQLFLPRLTDLVLVCHRWHQIICSPRSPFYVIHLDLNESNYTETNVKDLLLLHSRRDISIRCSLRESSSSYSLELANSILSLLCGNPTTWNRIRYIFDGVSFYASVNNLFSSENGINPVMLRSSNISTIEFRTIKLLAGYCMWFNSLSFASNHFEHLRALILEGIANERFPNGVHLPNLRHLELLSIRESLIPEIGYPHNIRRILSNSSINNLRLLLLTGVEYFYISEDLNEPKIAASEVILKGTCCFVASVLTVFRFPSCAHLTVEISLASSSPAASRGRVFDGILLDNLKTFRFKGQHESGKLFSYHRPEPLDKVIFDHLPILCPGEESGRAWGNLYDPGHLRRSGGLAAGVQPG